MTGSAVLFVVCIQHLFGIAPNFLPSIINYLPSLCRPSAPLRLKFPGDTHLWFFYLPIVWFFTDPLKSLLESLLGIATTSAIKSHTTYVPLQVGAHWTGSSRRTRSKSLTFKHSIFNVQKNVFDYWYRKLKSYSFYRRNCRDWCTKATTLKRKACHCVFVEISRLGYDRYFPSSILWTRTFTHTTPWHWTWTQQQASHPPAASRYRREGISPWEVAFRILDLRVFK